MALENEDCSELKNWWPWLLLWLLWEWEWIDPLFLELLLSLDVLLYLLKELLENDLLWRLLSLLSLLLELLFDVSLFVLEVWDSDELLFLFWIFVMFNASVIDIISFYWWLYMKLYVYKYI